MSCLDKNVRNQPACRAEAWSASRSKTWVRVRGVLTTGGWEPTRAWCLWTCTLVIDPLSWEWWVGEKEMKDLMLESIERASGWVVAWRRRRFVTCCPSCLHKDWVLRLHFASPQNIDHSTHSLSIETETPTSWWCGSTNWIYVDPDAQAETQNFCIID